MPASSANAASSSSVAASAVNGKVPIARLSTTSSAHKPAKTLAKLLPQSHSTSAHHTVKSSSQSAGLASGRGDTIVGGGEDSSEPVELRSSHNIVEKRYRMSINDKLGELRELVDGRDSKVRRCITTS